MDVEEVAPGTYRLDTPLAGVQNTFSVYFIKEDGGVLIEPGPAAAIPAILDGMKRLGITGLSLIIPTHIHVDHAGGLGKLAGLFPEAAVVLHPRGIRHMVDPSRLIDSTRVSFGQDFDARYGPIVPVPEARIKVPVDSEKLAAGGRELQIIYAPGHAPHHLAIFDLKTNGLFCGEALGLLRPHGTGVFVSPTAIQPSFDLEDALQTMDRLRQLKPQVLFYSHDGARTDVEKLIAEAGDNTRIFGDIILNGLRRGDRAEDIGTAVRQYVRGRFGFEMDEPDTLGMVEGYVLHFKKKGLA